MDRVIDRLHQAGIKVILGTTTYSIPPWLYKEHPEILVTRFDGQKATYGIRQNMDISHPTFRNYAERVIRQVISHYEKHPAIIGFQVDNETSSYGTAGPNVQKDFVEYLKEKFGTTAGDEQGSGDLSTGDNCVNSWDEMPPARRHDQSRLQARVGALPAEAGDRLSSRGRRRSSASTSAPTSSSRRTSCGGVRTDVDQPAIARFLDIAAVNPYHIPQDEESGWFLAALGRSLPLAQAAKLS